MLQMREEIGRVLANHARLGDAVEIFLDMDPRDLSSLPAERLAPPVRVADHAFSAA